MTQPTAVCPASILEPDALKTLTAINAQDLLHALNLDQVQRGRRILHWLASPFGRRFARQVLTYDALVGRQGLAVGGRWMLEQFTPAWEISGTEQIPRHGPLLIVANHPGLCDTVALFSAIPRDDLRIIAADRPFLRALPNTSRQLIMVNERATERMNVLRAGARHLRSQGALLTFPAGKIEPDPAVLPGAAAELAGWGESIELFARLVPELQVVPIIVSGVLAARALHHPLTRLYRTAEQRERLAAMLQILLPRLRTNQLRVAVGKPIHADGQALGPRIIASAAQLIAQAETFRP